MDIDICYSGQYVEVYNLSFYNIRKDYIISVFVPFEFASQFAYIPEKPRLIPDEEFAE